MAGFPNVPGGGAVTGVPGQTDDPYAADLNTLAAQQLAQAQAAAGQQNLDFLSTLTEEQKAALMASLQTQPQQTAPSTGPIKVPIGGQVYEFANEAELGQHMANYYTNVMQEAERKVANADASTATPTPTEAPQLDIKKFVDTFSTDPVAAFEYVDSIRYFDGKEEKPSEIIRDRLAAGEETERQLAIYQFKAAHPELDGNVAAAKVIDDILAEQDMNFNFKNLESAHGVAVSRGQLPSPQALQLIQQQQAYIQQLQAQQAGQPVPGLQPPGFTQQQTPPPTYQQPPLFNNGQLPGQSPQPYLPPAPPAVGPGVGEATGLNFNPEDLSADQLGAILQQASAPTG
jgi:hypothetical protein